MIQLAGERIKMVRKKKETQMEGQGLLGEFMNHPWSFCILILSSSLSDWLISSKSWQIKLAGLSLGSFQFALFVIKTPIGFPTEIFMWSRQADLAVPCVLARLRKLVLLPANSALRHRTVWCETDAIGHSKMNSSLHLGMWTYVQHWAVSVSAT